MPRFPAAASTDAGIGTSVFSGLADRIATFRGESYPLHVGDTWREPAEGCRMEDLRVADHPGMHRYATPLGMLELRAAAAARVEARSGVATSADDVLITTGVTGGLGAAVGALVAPGEEVLIPAPYWPLTTGVVRAFHGRPVVVPLLEVDASPEAAVAALAAAATERTVALYLNTPNNPTGRALDPEVLAALVAWATAQGLWIFADEVYEDYLYHGVHTPPRSLAPERTLSFHSFSKAYGMAGNRCGYVVMPRQLVPELLKIGTHSFYSTPTASQLAGVRVLGPAGDAWIAAARDLYQEAGEAAAARLGVPPPAAGTFLFFDVAEHLDDRGLAGLLEDLAERGLFLAPGPSFGPYPTYVRLCFTAVEPERTARGVEILARHLGR